MITLYDLPSTLPIKAWSPNVWKARYCLNYKGFPYKTEWVEFPDIEAVYKSIGIQPSRQRPVDRQYTLPAIYDSSTGAFVSDSFLIAEYLDKTYPDTPKVLPVGTHVLQTAFLVAIMPNLVPMWHFSGPAWCEKLNPPSREFYKVVLEGHFGKKLEDIVPTGDERVERWQKVKDGYDKVDSWLQKNGDSAFVMGETISFADFVISGAILALREVWGEESKEWKDIKTWNGGRWEGFLNNLEKYRAVI